MSRSGAAAVDDMDASLARWRQARVDRLRAAVTPQQYCLAAAVNYFRISLPPAHRAQSLLSSASIDEMLATTRDRLLRFHNVPAEDHGPVVALFEAQRVYYQSRRTHFCKCRSCDACNNDSLDMLIEATADAILATESQSGSSAGVSEGGSDAQPQRGSSRCVQAANLP